MPYADAIKQAEYQRRWIAKRRSEYLRGKVCVKCAQSDDLHVHHTDQSQKVEHRIWSWSKARREEELRKCQILCSECHKAEHNRDKHSYHRWRRGCRCAVCFRCMQAASRKRAESKRRTGR